MTAPSSTSGRSVANFRGWSDLRLLGRQLHYEQLSFWLNRVGAVFTIGFSVVFLLLSATSAGNSRIPYEHDIRYVQYYVPAFAAYGVMAACFNMLTILLVVRRETGLLKRMRLSPLPTWAMVGGILLNAVLVSAAQVILILVIGRFGYHVALPGNPLAFAVTLLTGAVCFTALGIGVSTLIPNQESAGPVTGIVFFVLLFLSGLFFPIKAGSGLANFASYFPMRHLILATLHSYGHGAAGWDGADLWPIALWGMVGLFVAVRRFRWEPRIVR